MTRAWMQTITGRAIVMALPSAREIDPIADMPEMLARIARFNGAVAGGNFSVAQHCCLIADAILDETGDANLATIGLLHDAHEYIWGDITTPQADGLAEIETEIYGDSRIRNVIETAKLRADLAIFRSCGVPWPPTADQTRIVKQFDLRMLATEKRQLLAGSARRWSEAVEKAQPIALRGGLRLWSIAKAAEEYRRRLTELCPALAHASTRHQEV